jgi:DNA ligase (NAD+)
VGSVNAKLLSQTFQSAVSLSQASVAEIMGIHGIGAEIAHAIQSWFTHPKNQALITQLQAQGLALETAIATTHDVQSLSGQTFVITGTLPTLKRSQVKAIIENAGGKVTGSVSKKTSYLILGTDPGSKFQKAVDLGVPQLSESDLLERIHHQSD